METIQYSLSNSRSYSINLNSCLVYTHTYSKNEKITIDKETLQRNVVEEIYTKIEKKQTKDDPQKYKEQPTYKEKKCKEQKYNSKNKKKQIDTSIFDTECLERYGDIFCILFELDAEDTDLFEIRMFKEAQLRCIKYTKKQNLHNDIPNFLKDGYTVVIIEKNKKDEKYDISCTHSRTS
jgi:hypothetical protein